MAKYEACITETCLRMLTVYGFANSWKKSPQALRQVSHWCTRQCTSSAKDSLGCCLNHCTSASCTSSSDINVWPLRAFFNGSKMWKLHGNKSTLYAGCLSTSHHMGFSSELCRPHVDGHHHAAGWCHAVSRFTWTFCSWSWYADSKAFDSNGLHQ